jgi:glycosyltransferase involved in cell wall biosynthesis
MNEMANAASRTLEAAAASPSERGTVGNPLVSIVVPVRDGGRFLRESLDSILGQTYEPFEVIVMDDASTDDTAAIIHSYGDAVRSYRNDQPLGIYANANAGIAKADGAFIAVFHADDVYMPEILEREVAWLQRYPHAGAVFSTVEFIDVTGRRIGGHPIPREVKGELPLDYATVLNTMLSWKNRFLACPTALVWSEVYRELGGYRQDEFKNTSDIEMWLRIAHRYPIGVIQEPLLRYRRGHGSSSERYHRLRTEQERFFTILDLELENHGRLVARPNALHAYEAHRDEDKIMRAIRYYVLGSTNDARALLRTVSTLTLLRSPRVQRGRLVPLLVALRALVRLPRSERIAALMERRWCGEGGR